MAESYISEVGDSLSHGVSNTNGERVKIIAPKLYNDGNGNHPSIATALSGKAASNHTHGNITNDGKIGSTAGLAVVTGTSGAVTTADLTTASPTVPTSGTTTSLEFIDTVAQDSNGKISATKKAVPVDSTYSSTGTNPVNGKAIAAAIGGLDSNKTSTDGTNVQVKVTENDGKISAVNVTTDNTENKNNKVSSWQTTPDNTHYPSEKLVKDGLDAKWGHNKLVSESPIDLDGLVVDSFYELTAPSFDNSPVSINQLSLLVTTSRGRKFQMLMSSESETSTTHNIRLFIRHRSVTHWGAWVELANTSAVNEKVTGPSSATADNIAVFYGATGKLVKDSGLAKSSVESAISKAGSAIQGVKVNNTTLTPDANKVVTVPLVTTSADGAMSAADKTKLDGIAAGAEVNQNAFSNVKVGSTTVSADSKTDTLELASSSAITLTPDAANDKVTIGVSTMGAASSSAAGTAGIVPAPGAGKQASFLRGDGTWVVPTNTDTKQRIVASDSKTYLTGVTTAPTSSNQDLTGVANANVYATAGQLHATTFDVNSKCTLQFNTTTNALDFVFA